MVFNDVAPGVSLEGFLQFVTDNPEIEYKYTEAHDCAFSKYLRSMGHPRAVTDPVFYTLDNRGDRYYRLDAVHPKLNEIVMLNYNFYDLKYDLSDLVPENV